MLPVFLLAMLFVSSDGSLPGSLPCFLEKFSLCYRTFDQRWIQQECAADQAIQCLKQKAEECDFTEKEQVLGMGQILTDICQTGSEMNAGFLKLKNCTYETKLKQLNEKCKEDLEEAFLKYKMTGNAKKDQKAMFEIGCRYFDVVKNCVSGNFRDVCGEDVQSFHRKFTDPAYKLTEMACNNSPATFGNFGHFYFKLRPF